MKKFKKKLNADDVINEQIIALASKSELTDTEVKKLEALQYIRNDNTLSKKDKAELLLKTLGIAIPAALTVWGIIFTARLEYVDEKILTNSAGKILLKNLFKH